MRPKFIFALFLLAGLVLGAAFLLKQPATPPLTSPEAATPVPTVNSKVMASTVLPSAPAPAPAPTNTLTPEQRQTAIDAEVDQLQQWSMKDDPASLSSILADLTNPEKEIRDAAIEAAKQFGSTNAIPALKEAANAMEDTQEKIACLEAADFLALPSVDLSGPGGDSTPRTPEQIQMDEQQKAQAEARRQAHLQKRAAHQNPQASPDQSPTPTDTNQ